MSEIILSMMVCDESNDMKSHVAVNNMAAELTLYTKSPYLPTEDNGASIVLPHILRIAGLYLHKPMQLPASLTFCTLMNMLQE